MYTPAPESEVQTIENVSKDFIWFEDRSGIHLSYLPDAKPGQQVVITKDANTNIIISATIIK